jgi:hypothetical protein
MGLGDLLAPSVVSTLVLIGLGALLVPTDARTAAGRLGRKLLLMQGVLLLGIVILLLTQWSRG